IGTFRPGGIQADAPITGAEVHDELAQGTAVIGGPISSNAHFLISGEYSNQNRDSEVTSPLAPQVVTGDYHQSLFLAKADYQINNANTLTGRFNLERFSDSNPQDVVGGTTLPSAGRVFRRNTYIGQVSDTTLFSESLFNEARFSVQYGSPITQFDPVNFSTQLVRPGVSTEGESRSALLHNHQFQFANTLSWSRGSHFLKFGGDVVHSSSGGNSKEFGGPFVLGQFTFNPAIPASVPTSALTINDVTRYTQGFGNFDYENSEELYSIFAQDDFHIRENLVLNLGVRYDRQTFTDDSNNLAPRLGFAYNPGSDQRTVIRGGYGIYYSEIPANFQADYSLGGPNGFFSFTASPGQLGFPTDLNPLPEFPPGAVLPPRNINVRPGDPGFYNQFFDVTALLNYPDKLLNPRTDMITLGGERQFGEWFLSVDGVHSHSQDIPWNLDLNAPGSFDRTDAGQVRSGTVADTTRPIIPVANGYRQIIVTTSLGEAKYDALQVNLRRPIGSKANMLLSYTWSHSRNNTEPDAPGGAPMD
ncbi:MAG TPA: TonB-dependent receptor, partial [Acidobacteriota bacterium]